MDHLLSRSEGSGVHAPVSHLTARSEEKHSSPEHCMPGLSVIMRTADTINSELEYTNNLVNIPLSQDSYIWYTTDLALKYRLFRVTSSVVERFPDKKEVNGSIPL